MNCWASIEADLHDVYGIDVDDEVLMRSRSWRWLRVRILGLLDGETRTYYALYPPDTKEGSRGTRSG